MKKVNFTDDECSWLVSLLESRVDFFKAVDYIPVKYFDNTYSALEKLSIDAVNSFKEWERSMCSSCINEQLTSLYPAVKLPNAFSLLNNTDDYFRKLRYIDLGESILLKLGKKKKAQVPWHYERTSYEEYLNRINKLKNSDMIYLSGRDRISPYKIGFVHQQQEVCVFELRQEIKLNSLCFTPLRMDAFMYGSKFFQMINNRQQAREKLNKYNESEYPDGQLQFLLQILN